MAKRITFYPTADDQRHINQIQELRPHWNNVNFIIREALWVLLQQLSQPTITPPSHTGSD